MFHIIAHPSVTISRNASNIWKVLKTLNQVFKTSITTPSIIYIYIAPIYVPSVLLSLANFQWPFYNTVKGILEPKYDKCFCEDCARERGDAKVHEMGNPKKKFTVPWHFAKFGVKWGVLPWYHIIFVVISCQQSCLGYQPLLNWGTYLMSTTCATMEPAPPTYAKLLSVEGYWNQVLSDATIS